VSTLENLIAARALIDTPEKMFCFSDNALAFQHAMDVAVDPFDEVGYVGAIAALRSAKSTGPGLLSFIRSATHSDIMALFDRAIAACTTDRVQS